MEQIEIEKKREKDLKEQIKAHGELLTNIKTALQSMNIMLLCIRYSGKGTTRKVVKNGNKKESVINDREHSEEHDVLAEIEEMDVDGKEIYIYISISNIIIKEVIIKYG